MRKDRRSVRLVGYVVFAWLLPLLSFAGGRDPEPRYDFNIPALKASAALELLAKQTDAQLLFPYDVAESIEANRVSGRYTLPEALAKLLKGTGLSGSLTPARVITITASGNNAERNGGQSMTKTRKWSFLGAIAAFMGAHASHADEQSASTSPALEEIVVTAQKREERLQDVPQSVSVVTAADITNLAAVQFSDYASTVPGLTYKSSGVGNSQISLRGVTTGLDPSPTVGIYVDEVPYGSSTPFALAGRIGFDVGLFDLDRIEVLRGPQGTLYGASALGGVIKYVTQRPNTSQFGGDAQVGTSSTENGGVSYNVAAAVNMPFVNDEAALRLSGFESHDGGYIENVRSGQKDINHSDVNGGRADFLFKPTDALSIRLVGFLQDISRAGDSTVDCPAAGNPPKCDPVPALRQNRGYNGEFDQHFRLGSGTVNYDFGPVDLTSVSSYQTVKTDWILDASGLAAGLDQCPGFCGSFGAIADDVLLKTNKFTQELRLASKAATTLEWVVGGYYTHETALDFENFLLRNLAGQPLPNNLFTYNVPTIYNESAIFGDLTWHPLSHFDITGGLRYSHDEQTFTQMGSGAFIGGSSPIPFHASEGVVTYLGSARYHITDQTMAYLRFATGYRPGGPNIVLATFPPGTPTKFDADSLKSYEMGFKSGTPDQRYAVDIAGYYIDWHDLQTQTQYGGFNAFTNASSPAHIQGIELNLTARPLTDITVSSALAYQHAYLTEADATLKNAAGERLPNVPRFTATINADYAIVENELRPSVGAAIRYVSARTAGFNDSTTVPQYALPAYATLDFRAAATFEKINAQIYLHNALNKRGQIAEYAPPGGGDPQVAIVQPRTVGVSFNVKF